VKVDHYIEVTEEYESASDSDSEYRLAPEHERETDYQNCDVLRLLTSLILFY
jgi:hypothetical protein